MPKFIKNLKQNVLPMFLAGAVFIAVIGSGVWLIYKEMAGFSGAGVANKLLFGAETPAELKVSKDKIINSQEFTETVFDGNATTTKQIVAYAYKSGEAAPAMDNEIIEKRTENIVTRNLGGNKRSAETGYNFYQENGEWKQVKFATTTKEIFDKETLSPISWLIKTVWAASSGPNSGGTFVDDTSIGTEVWNNPGNAISDDGVEASNYGWSNAVSHYLKATNFGFSIPGGATINGIVVEANWYYGLDEEGVGNVIQNSVKIVKGGSISGTDLSAGTVLPDYGTVYLSFGSSSNLWGLSWTDTDINASNFGVAFSSISSNGSTGTISLMDHIRITVYYTAAAQTISPQTIIFRGGSDAIFRGNGTVIFRAP